MFIDFCQNPVDYFQRYNKKCYKRERKRVFTNIQYEINVYNFLVNKFIVYEKHVKLHYVTSRFKYYDDIYFYTCDLFARYDKQFLFDYMCKTYVATHNRNIQHLMYIILCCTNQTYVFDMLLHYLTYNVYYIEATELLTMAFNTHKQMLYRNGVSYFSCSNFIPVESICTHLTVNHDMTPVQNVLDLLKHSHTNIYAVNKLIDGDLFGYIVSQFKFEPNTQYNVNVIRQIFEFYMELIDKMDREMETTLLGYTKQRPDLVVDLHRYSRILKLNDVRLVRFYIDTFILNAGRYNQRMINKDKTDLLLEMYRQSSSLTELNVGIRNYIYSCVEMIDPSLIPI
jgi:hypothetical protein